jgi:Holliday junction resolvase RusA-like endonuclease
MGAIMAKYIIPLTPPSLNKYAGRENVWEYRAEKTRWKGICAAYCRPRPKQPPEYARVTLTFFFDSRRRHDADNYQKFILDGLVAAGVIMDDDFAHVQVLCKGGYDKKNPRTEIEIMRLKGGE